MIKNNPIIKATLVLVAFIYTCLAIYMLINKIPIFALASSLLNSIFLIIGSTILGFGITLVAISGVKNYQLNLLLKANGNGRYGTTQGYLPQRQQLACEKISLTKDLPTAIQEWIKAHELSHKPAINLFITLAGILKANLNLSIERNKDISLYAHSIRICEKLVLLNNLGSAECNAYLIKNGYLSPNNMKSKYIDELVNAQALPLIAIMHDVGKISANIQKDGIVSYLENYPHKSKLIVSSISYFWELEENIRDSLLFATAYYNDLANCPKIILDKQLVAKYVRGELLIQLLIAAHNEVASYESIEYKPISSQVVTKVSLKVEDTEVTDDEPKLNINTNVTSNDSISPPRPKKRNPTKQTQVTNGKELPNTKITSVNQKSVEPKKQNKSDSKVPLNAVFSTQNALTTVDTKKTQEADETIKLSDVFGGGNDK